MQSNVFVGIKPCIQTNTSLQTLSSKYDYLLLPITNSRYKETVKSYYQTYRELLLDEPFCVPAPQLQDISLSPPIDVNRPDDPNSVAYIGLLSSWLELDSEEPLIRELSCQVLINECRFARFIGIKKVLLAPPRDLVNLQYYSQTVFRLISQKENFDQSLTLSISLPLCEDSDPLATWELWHTIRKLCHYHPNLTISLALPRVKTPGFVLRRWLCEPVSCLLISSSIFVPNHHNYPVLNKFNQNVILKFQEVNGNSQIQSNDLCMLLHGMEKYSNQVKGGANSYLDYVNFLLKKGDKLILSERIQGLHEPKLLPPLKPNSENLNNEVYSVFERDSAKYDMYEKAISKALSKVNFSTVTDATSPFIILVAGAGRGGLVDRVFHVASTNNILSKVKIIALEKNAQAYLFLQKRNYEKWNNIVELINRNMFDWSSMSIKVDLCVSELLGSFGCNELSPECLMNIQRYHSKPTTIYIPQSYTSCIAPITCPLFYQKMSSDLSSTEFMESPWVAHNVPYQILSSRVNELWTFQHPLPRDENFNRSVLTEFKIKHRVELHGFIGYFVARLYDDECVLSIIPDKVPIKTSNGTFHDFSHTENLVSWSPMVFPLRQPVTIADDTEIQLLISRTASGDKTWYEWSFESFIYLVVSQEPQKNAASNVPRSLASNHTAQGHQDIMRSHPFQTQYLDDEHIGPHESETSYGSRASSSAVNAPPFKNTEALPHYENEWQSLKDIHGWNTQESFSDKHLPNEGRNGTHSTPHARDPLEQDPTSVINQDPRSSGTQEVHVRIKVGSSHIHNINGHAFHIPWKS
ncbi:protein arginine N-methyltransferase KNAG_0B01260 [Huiozyma naganishii CBS 8797]|uniref:Protein arginine N-methyltransferase n=1 Tax=Huiozyma naganishii (strain ATCC MYA-139 / BCRC 22969 / CBS 8797 / KCTC 17520 / NBRC 10181 / NCYC 3082 / Yp74L-3) TaxID=1071383 RepID=J7RGB0_HUIN7|nr:hypothetical protein KNAG_0B01260 [Kazachstania naganishii CBS 8797]CCK68573.1 hypothetical protein KNAG_0B01260 [Kazachstania naganishii CBS 8797]